MHDDIRRALDGLRPSLKESGAEVELVFADEDFGVVELKLRVPEAKRRSLQDRLETALLRDIPGVRQVEFPADAPEEAEPEPTPPEMPGLAAGARLALDILSTSAEKLAVDAQAGALKERRGAESFLGGPYRSWLAEGERTLSAGKVKEGYASVDRAARALVRVLETESSFWTPNDPDLPPCLSADSRREIEEAADILATLRPKLGDSTLAGFAAGDEWTSDSDAAAPSVSLLDRIFKDAARRKVRDVYIVPLKDKAALRYRKGGRMEAILEFPRSFYGAVLARLKHLASLDVAERKRKQEGLIKFTDSSGYGGLSVQVQTIPDAGEERVHLRLSLPEQAS